jgi:hypothetical protein
MHLATRTLVRFSTILAAAAFSAATAGCSTELNPHSREVDADHTVAFVAQDDDLRGQLTVDQDGYSVTPVIERGTEVFNRVGVRYDAPGTVIAEARARTDGSWGTWSELTENYRDEAAHNGFLDVAANSDAAQLRFKLETGSSLSFLVTETFVYEPAAADVDLDVDAEPVSESLQGLAADGIVVTRSQWGARSRSCGHALVRASRLFAWRQRGRAAAGKDDAGRGAVDGHGDEEGRARMRAAARRSGGVDCGPRRGGGRGRGG